MAEWIYIHDKNDNLVNDPENSTDYATGLQWSSAWPKGHLNASFSVARDIAKRWAVKSAYKLTIQDRHTILWQGRLAGLRKALKGTDESFDINADGFICLLADRKMRKRWVDNAAVQLLEQPAARIATAAQKELDSSVENNAIIVRAGYGDITRAGTEEHHQQYVEPLGTVVYKITFDYAMRSGEGVAIQWYNDDQASAEGSVATSTGSVVTGTVDDTFAAGDTDSFTIKFKTTVADIYDEHDWMQVANLAVYGVMDSFGSPTYTAAEIVQDVLEILTTGEISADYDALTDPGLALIPFTTKGDDMETGDSIIQRAVAFGDSSQNTYGFQVWDSFGTSDDLPKAEIKQRDVTDYEYQVFLADVQDFSDEEYMDELYNYITVKYIDTLNRDAWITPVDDADLKDTTSISDYDQRDYVLDVGKCDSGTATSYGTRFLALHKDPLQKMSFSIVGQIRNKSGVWVSTNRIRAGDRILLTDYPDKTGTIIFISQVNYDAESRTARIDRDVPPNSLDILFAQQELAVV